VQSRSQNPNRCWGFLCFILKICANYAHIFYIYIFQIHLTWRSTFIYLLGISTRRFNFENFKDLFIGNYFIQLFLFNFLIIYTCQIISCITIYLIFANSTIATTSYSIQNYRKRITLFAIIYKQDYLPQTYAPTYQLSYL
jgi:hypothetical protein